MLFSRRIFVADFFLVFTSKNLVSCGTTQVKYDTGFTSENSITGKCEIGLCLRIPDVKPRISFRVPMQPRASATAGLWARLHKRDVVSAF